MLTYSVNNCFQVTDMLVHHTVHCVFNVLHISVFSNRAMRHFETEILIKEKTKNFFTKRLCLGLNVNLQNKDLRDVQHIFSK